MPLTSTFKDSLSFLINHHYYTTTSFNEVWSVPTNQESSDPSARKLSVTMTFPGRAIPVTFFAVVPDESQESVDMAYSRFLDDMTRLFEAGRNPFGA